MTDAKGALFLLFVSIIAFCAFIYVKSHAELLAGLSSLLIGVVALNVFVRFVTK